MSDAALFGHIPPRLTSHARAIHEERQRNLSPEARNNDPSSLAARTERDRTRDDIARARHHHRVEAGEA